MNGKIKLLDSNIFLGALTILAILVFVMANGLILELIGLIHYESIKPLFSLVIWGCFVMSWWIVIGLAHDCFVDYMADKKESENLQLDN